MRLELFKEPQLEFGKDTHPCPRAGISQYGVYDTRLATRRTKIHVGAVGISNDLDKLAQWLDKCKGPIPGKAETKQPELFATFCGFNTNVGLRQNLYSNRNSRDLSTCLILEIFSKRRAGMRK